MERSVLILGANGRFGRNAAAQFAAAGWKVHRFDRKSDDLSSCAKEASVIVNGWNPAYVDWKKQVPQIHAKVIDAARASGATVILPGNVYVFGADTPAPWSASSPHAAQNPLGLIRIRMEEAYREADVKTIMLRAGDFIDTKPSGNWFDQVLVKSIGKGRFVYPGNPDIPHAWAYLPDYCRAVVRLAENQGDLERYTDIPFPGYTMSGREMAEILNRIVPEPVRLQQMSRLPLYLAQPFWPLAGKLLEMSYLWDTPHWLDRRDFDAILPRFRNTPVREALASAIPSTLIQHKVNPNKPVSAGG